MYIIDILYIKIAYIWQIIRKLLVMALLLFINKVQILLVQNIHMLFIKVCVEFKSHFQNVYTIQNLF